VPMRAQTCAEFVNAPQITLIYLAFRLSKKIKIRHWITS